MRRKFDFSVGEYYHVYSRGVERREVFIDQHDYVRFSILLYLCNSKVPVDIRDLFQTREHKGRSFVEEVYGVKRGNNIVDIGAYCLMPNHFHLLLREAADGGVSIFMKKLLTAYSSYFNKRHKRTGSLFDGRFKAEHANTDHYLKYLFSYIHLNPLKLVVSDWKERGIKNIPGAEKFLAEYPHSSYFDYTRTRRSQGNILQYNKFPKYFSSQADFLFSVKEWLSLGREDAEN